MCEGLAYLIMPAVSMMADWWLDTHPYTVLQLSTLQLSQCPLFHVATQLDEVEE